MFLTVHGTTGLIVGKYTGNIFIAFITAFIFHFLFDIIPHGDEFFIKDDDNKNKKFVFSESNIRKLKIATLIDVTVMSILMLIFYFNGIFTNPLPILFGMAGGIFPDFLVGIYILTKNPWLKNFFNFHDNVHHIFSKLKIPSYVGLLIQIGLFIFLVSWVLLEL